VSAHYADEDTLVDALLGGDERAFAWLLDTYDGALRRLARMYVSTDAVAEEVVAETWLGVVKGLDRFERRSSLKTWIYRILMNLARTRGVKESRSIPFSSAVGVVEEGTDPAVDPDRFLPLQHDRWPGHWASPPAPWESLPEERLLGRETLACVADAIAKLPTSQREVIILRDVEGWSSSEVCNALDLSETNQRVLLHRARSKVRRACEELFRSRVT
jgi:RNA polymerase sigma-70 factor (ECF subfamily)